MKGIFLSLSLLGFPIYENTPLIIEDEKGEELKSINQTAYYTMIKDPLFVSETSIYNLVNELEQKVYKEPVNAKIDDSGQIIAEKSGQMLNKETLYNQLQQYVYSESGNRKGSLIIPTKEIKPKITTKILAEIRQKKIGNYVTYFNTNHSERTHNIILAAKAIHNYVLMPDEEFSFNKVVGERTIKKGYQRAPVIVKGELSEDIGGGICQVSSTLFNAVNLEGIHIVKRYSHSRAVPYVPKGKDATVSWWGPDFVFKNEFNKPILIQAKVQYGSMIVSVYAANDISY